MIIYKDYYDIKYIKLNIYIQILYVQKHTYVIIIFLKIYVYKAPTIYNNN